MLESLFYAVVERIVVTIARITLALVVLILILILVLIMLTLTLIFIFILVTLILILTLISFIILITLTLIIHKAWGIFSGLRFLFLAIHSLDFDTKRSHLPGPFRANMCHSTPEPFFAFIL